MVQRADEGVERAQGELQRVLGRHLGHVEGAQSGGGQAGVGGESVQQVVDALAQFDELRGGVEGVHAPESDSCHTVPASTRTGMGCPVERSMGSRAPASATIGVPVVEEAEALSVSVAASSSSSCSTVASVDLLQCSPWCCPRNSPSATTHIAVALAVAACRAGYSIYFTSLDDMVRNLKAAEAAGRLLNKLGTYLRPSVLVVDEVGYQSLERAEANLVFQVISKRYEKGSIILTSNKTFSEWGQVFGDEVLATAILDRLLHHCEVISINGPSYRLKNRLKAIERENDVA